MKPFHGLLLRFVHFKLPDGYLVLIALTAGAHLIPDVDVRPAASPSLLQEYFIVAHFKLVGCEARLVVLQVLLLAIIRVTLASAVGALWRAIRISVRPGQQDGSLVESWLRWLLFLFFNHRLLLLFLSIIVIGVISFLRLVLTACGPCWVLCILLLCRCLMGCCGLLLFLILLLSRS